MICVHVYTMAYADPDSFVGGSPTLRTFFVVCGEGGPKCQWRFAGVPMLAQTWSFVIFRGSGPVLIRNPTFVIFRGGGGGPDPLSPPSGSAYGMGIHVCFLFVLFYPKWYFLRQIRIWVNGGTVLCPWTLYPLLSTGSNQEIRQTSRYDWKIVNWDFKHQHKQRDES